MGIRKITLQPNVGGVRLDIRCENCLLRASSAFYLRFHSCLWFSLHLSLKKQIHINQLLKAKKNLTLSC